MLKNPTNELSAIWRSPPVHPSKGNRKSWPILRRTRQYPYQNRYLDGDWVMVHHRSTTLSQQLYSLVNSLDSSPQSDLELIGEFIDHPNEETFASLLRRFGPMILRVCRRVIGDPHLAEDAFQATFLVFVQKAKTLINREKVSNWLYGVAYRISLAARRKKYKSVSEHSLLSLSPSAESQASTREIASLIDEELYRLPEEYRIPFLLCFVEGLTRDQVSHRLGISLRTLTRRLDKGKELLKVRLSRKGVSLSSLLIAASSTSGTSIVPSHLVRTLMENVSTWIPNLSTAASEISPNLICLAEAGIAKPALYRSMTWIGMVLSGAVLFAVSYWGFSEAQTKSEGIKKERTEKRMDVSDSVPKWIFDPEGGQLPRDAVMRIGSTRFRHSGTVNEVVFSPDGKWLGSISTDVRDRTARIWDMATGKEKLRFVIQAKTFHQQP